MCIKTLLGDNIEVVELYKQGVNMLEDIIRHSRYTEIYPEAARLEQIIAIYIRLGTIAYIAAGVLRRMEFAHWIF